MKFVIFIIFLLSIPFINAETTFFDIPNDIFIIGTSPTQIAGGTIGGGDCDKELEIIVPSEINITQGKTKQINITIKNIGSCVLYDINVSLDVPTGWNSNSDIINKLYRNENQIVILNITPSKSALDDYSIIIKADTIGEHKKKEIVIWIIEEDKKNSEKEVRIQEEIGMVIEKEVEKQKKKKQKINIKNKIVYFIILIFVFVIFYQKRDYFKRMYGSKK